MSFVCCGISGMSCTEPFAEMILGGWIKGRYGSGMWINIWQTRKVICGCEVAGCGCEVLRNGCDVVICACDIVRNGCEVLRNGCEIVICACDVIGNAAGLLYSPSVSFE